MLEFTRCPTQFHFKLSELEGHAGIIQSSSKQWFLVTLSFLCVGLLVAMKFVCYGSGGACEDAD